LIALMDGHTYLTFMAARAFPLPMESTDRLKHEHAIIKRVLAALKTCTERGDVPVAILKDLVTFSQTFVDRCHHGKEERCLFPCLEERGVPKEGGPIGVMLMEHEMGRNLVRRIGETTGRVEAGEAGREEAVALVEDYVDLLENHIFKEDNILFNMATQAMAATDDDHTTACFEKTEEERVGPGVHDEMITLVGRIEDSAPRKR